MPYESINLRKVITYPLPKRKNRVNKDNFFFPENTTKLIDNLELNEVSQRIVTARQNAHPVVFMFGGHIIKRGLAPLVIELMKLGVITHLASNGAATIHDFEIAFQGQTSEDVATSLEDGSFGMAEETGSFMNHAIQLGALNGLGIGEALGKFIAENDLFEFRKFSILYNAYLLRIPYTVHVAIGTDIIHQHPSVDFSSLGWATGQDFKIFINTISKLEGGVFCNIGSAVIGPEVFLKALSIVRNLGYNVKRFTTANFDIIPLNDYRKPIADDQPDYYYRPRKNVVNRPVSLGGKGFHITGDFIKTIPTLFYVITNALKESNLQEFHIKTSFKEISFLELHKEIQPQYSKVISILNEAIKSTPKLEKQKKPLYEAFHILSESFKTGGTLFLAGNGGSMSDALHISGELLKSYKNPRPLPEFDRKKLDFYSGESKLGETLQRALRTIVLGINPSFASAVRNDLLIPHVEFAQELYALARPGDVFLGISTSGNAKNLIYASYVAKLVGLPIIILTGMNKGFLSNFADVSLIAPAYETTLVQEWHVKIYHILCEMLEIWLLEG